MPTLEFQAIVNSLQSAIFTPGNLVTVSAVTTVANVPVLDLTVNQIDTDSFTIDDSTTPPTLRITAHPEQSPWHSPIDADGHYLYDLGYIQFADGTIQTTAFNAAGSNQTPWLADIDAADFDLTNLASLEFSDGSVQSTAYLGVAATQTPWLQNINGNRQTLTNPGAVHIFPNAPADISFAILDATNPANIDFYVVDGNVYLRNKSIQGVNQLAVTTISFNSDLTTQTTAYKGVAANQTPWLQTINAAGHALQNVSSLTVSGTASFGGVVDGIGLVITRPAPANALVIYGPGQATIDWMVDSAGDILTLSNRSIDGLGHIKFADGTIQTTAFAAGSGAQTPWQTNIDAASHSLSFLSALNMLSGGPITNIGTLTFVNATIQNTAFPGITATQTPWLQNIDGARKTLSQVGQIVIWPVAGVQRFGITNDAGTGWDWLVDSTGNLSSATFKSILTLGSIGFADSTVQTTAFKGIAATQTPWLQEINANGHILNGAGSVVIWEAGSGSNNRFGIINAAFTQWHWKVDTSNNLISDTGRSITGINGISVATFTTSGIGVLGGNLNWSSAPGSGILDTAIGRISAGKLQLYGPSGSEGDLYLRDINSSGQVRSGALILGTNLALYNSANGLIIDSQALGVRARVDCGLLYSSDWVYGTGFVASGEIGLGDSQTTGPFEIQVTTPSGAKSLWFMGGILYAVT